uniref:Uncharacterized protein n=2 Tax=Saimiriine herpesvirus 2 TaxID=10381 RepID=Q805P0_SHV2|nr:hypothetical protein [Saimiriine gammaherpesvirus 2]CAC84348.1 hypothetical protein [Saimiriine gammaherpesvirus 2]
MASKKPSVDVDELQKELQRLKLENKTLKKKMQQVSPNDEMLTPSQKESIINSVVNSLTKNAEKKIRLRVSNDLLPLVTKQQCVDAIANIKYRIEVSPEEPQDKLRRAASKHKTSS